MKELNARQIGIAQGNEDVFSEFETGGDMWTGSGDRERRKTVMFERAYRRPPNVQVTLSLWDMDTTAFVRADLRAEKITCDGFDLVFRTWADTRIARVRMAWMAIGELPSDDDWQV
ncbi:MAG: H-type lectin domain-containing protein [Rhodobacteraceae bacterium]|nr:H-type lectin domain-containing protein [Paracoccaceae bacterium]